MKIIFFIHEFKLRQIHFPSNCCVHAAVKEILQVTQQKECHTVKCDSISERRK